jgi:hypothetical protein
MHQLHPHRVGALRMFLSACLAFLLGACATPVPFDYTAFKQDRPASLLVLPPLNESKDIKATSGVLATTTLPLAEAGYYVMPVSLVDETFKQNGLTTPTDIHEVPAAKLREIFGADAAVYIRVKQYGTTYMIIGSETRVTVDGKIVDLRSGRVLWSGSATASSQESDSSSQAGLVGLLVKAVVTQIIGTVTDASFNYAGITNQRLLGAPRKNGLLAGPRSPSYQKD